MQICQIGEGLLSLVHWSCPGCEEAANVLLPPSHLLQIILQSGYDEDDEEVRDGDDGDVSNDDGDGQDNCNNDDDCALLSRSSGPAGQKLCRHFKCTSCPRSFLFNCFSPQKPMLREKLGS